MTAIDWNQFREPRCGLQQALQGHPARRIAASPYSVHHPTERAQEVALADN